MLKGVDFDFYFLVYQQSNIIKENKVEITKEDLLSFAHDQAVEEQEAKERAEKNECVCGTVNCSTEYACVTSGYQR